MNSIRHMNTLTPHDITACAELLKRLEPGFLPLEIFTQVARLVRLPMVDVVPLRYEDGVAMIGTLRRSHDDPWWPDEWHLPGTAFRSTDTLEDAISRLLQDEIATEQAGAPVFRGISIHESKRGAEVVLAYTVSDCVLRQDSPISWFPMDALPQPFIPSELNVIAKIRESLACQAMISTDEKSGTP
jgi:hypothetical protein